MTSDHHIHHEIDYIEFVVTDMTQAKRFYEAAFETRVAMSSRSGPKAEFVTHRGGNPTVCQGGAGEGPVAEPRVWSSVQNPNRRLYVRNLSDRRDLSISVLATHHWTASG